MQKIREAGGRPDDMAAALAQELGLSTAKVKAALEATRPQGMPPGTDSAPPSGDGQLSPPGGGQVAPSGTPAGAIAA